MAALHRGTDGNPLFLTELASLLSDERLLDEGAMERLPIPPGVHDAIGSRLRRLSPDCRSLLGLAWARTRVQPGRARAREPRAGRRSPGVARRGSRRIGNRRSAGHPRTIAVFHALVRDALYEQLGAARRTRLHAEIGEALVFLYASDPEPHLAEIAHHFFEAAPGGDRDGLWPGPPARAIAQYGFWPTRKPPASTAWL